MSRVEKTVFISYRRADLPLALLIFKDLTQNGYDAFIDYDGIASGDFERLILENIRARAHFVVVLTTTALDRCSEPGDWLRHEIESAIAERRNIVPLMFPGFDFSSPVAISKLTGTLHALKGYSGLEVPYLYFDAAMERLRQRHLNVPLEAVLHPASPLAAQAAKSQQRAAESAPQTKIEEVIALSIATAAMAGSKETSRGRNETSFLGRDGVPLLYRGAGPGTHFHRTDARLFGFAAAPGVVTPNGTLRQIADYSFPSPFLSFSASFSVARSYALTGPAGVATAKNPGFVYEVNLSALAKLPELQDPVHTISTHSPFAHCHGAGIGLVFELVRGIHGFKPVHQPSGRLQAPNIPAAFIALVFAIRDAEILVTGDVAAAAIVNRHSVWGEDTQTVDLNPIDIGNGVTATGAQITQGPIALVSIRMPGQDRMHSRLDLQKAMFLDPIPCSVEGIHKLVHAVLAAVDTSRL